jgi:hypothetical protein
LLGLLTLGAGGGIGLGLSEAPSYKTGWVSYAPDAAGVIHSSEGTLTGVAVPCIGLGTTARVAGHPVRVAVKKGSRTVGSEVVTGSHVYRLRVSPGRYTISSDQLQNPREVAVVVHSGETDHINLVSHCK